MSLADNLYHRPRTQEIVTGLLRQAIGDLRVQLNDFNQKVAAPAFLISMNHLRRAGGSDVDHEMALWGVPIGAAGGFTLSLFLSQRIRAISEGNIAGIPVLPVVHAGLTAGGAIAGYYGLPLINKLIMGT